MSNRRMPTVSMRVNFSERSFPSRDGSSSRVNLAYSKLLESFYCCLSLSSSASEVDLTAQLYSLMIRIKRINLKDFIICYVYETAPPMIYIQPGLTSTFDVSLLKAMYKLSHIHAISCSKLAVAIKSIQKKRPYLKSSFTQDMKSNSQLKRTNAMVRAAKKYGSADLFVSQSLI